MNDATTDLGQIFHENMKYFIATILSWIFAFMPPLESSFFDHDWAYYMPFLNFLKIILTIVSILITTILLIRRLLRKKDKSEDDE